MTILRRRTHHWLITQLLTKLRLPCPKSRTSTNPISSIQPVWIAHIDAGRPNTAEIMPTIKRAAGRSACRRKRRPKLATSVPTV